MCKKLSLFLLVFLTFAAWLPAAAAENVLLQGRIIDSKSGIPLVGAFVALEDHSAGTAADLDGAFSLEISAKLPISIEVSMIGYQTQIIPVTSVGEPLVVSLVEDGELLDEVIVLGYAKTTKNAMTSAVNTIQSESLENIQSSDINGKIQGAVPGLLVSSNAGIPGTSSMVRLRGATSITAANTPIYIVDGVFVSTDNPGHTDLGGLAIDPMADINPEDILSITVLKDASATAAYGARAANGVIIINTKRGSYNQRTQVNFKAQVGVSQATRLWELVTGPEHAGIVNQAWINDGKDPALRPFRPASEAVSGYPAYGTPEEQITVDRLSDIFRPALQQTYNLSVTSGNETTSFYIGGEYTNEDSILKLIDFERMSLRFNLDHQLRPHLKLSSSNAVVYTDRGLMRVGDGPAGLFQAALHTPTFQPVFKEDGSYNKPVSFDNHQAILDNWDGNSNNLRITNSLALTWDIADGVSLKSSFSNDRSVYVERFYYNTNLIYGQPNGAGVEGANTSNVFSTEHLLNFYRSFRSQLTLSAFLGTSFQYTSIQSSYINGKDYPSDQLTRIISSANQTATSTGTSSSLLSFFGGANLSYDSRYSLDLTLRADGSSRVGRNNRFGYFPAVGVAWNVTNEPFFPWKRTFNSLKLKASIGLGGNENIGDFSSLALWSGGANYNGEAGLSPEQLGNPDLRWETTRQWNVGLNASLWQQRVDVELNYYDKYTYDLLLARTVPWKTGFTSIVDNSGEISNRGVEFSLSTLNVEKKSFSWKTTFTLAHNRNRIEKLTTDVTGNYTPFKLFEGYPLYSMWVYEYLGVDPQTGDAIYNDTSGDGKITVADKKVVGNAWPVVEGLLRNTFSFGPVSLDVNFYYKYGNKVFNYTRMFLESGGTRGITRSMQASSVDYWKNPGDTDVLPRPKSTANADGSFNYEGQSSRVVEDGSFIRLKNVTLNYTIPTRLVQKIGLQRASVNITGGNLLLLTKYTGPDPEVNVNRGGVNGLVQGMDFGMPPQPRSLTLGLNITF
ncbi:MAG: SusC/RagA family TonB-linked outer membrane protein [Bacteroidales bacterium]|jgi:TonB-linked SusC/RagA family outer membrane protein|nr:SusC/RagA family TonB-linked outer membrane protein [Bacteroidales bacterium]